MIKSVLSKRGMIAYQVEPPVTITFNQEETKNLLKRDIDFDKLDHFCEIAHLEISNRCNMNCSYCYVGEKEFNELPLEAWMYIIDNLANYGVFQVSFGGGEPLMYPYIVELAEYIRSKGINLGMTTNGTKLLEMSRIWPKLKDLFNQINISWHQNPHIVERSLQCLHDNNVKAGINYCFSKDMAKDNYLVKTLAKLYGAEIIYLAYKPVVGDYDQLIPADEVYMVAKATSKQGIKVAVDGPCAGECMMKVKFIDVNHRGEVFPCSFVRNSIGNLLETDFKDIWSNRGEQDKCPYVEIKQRKE